MIKMLQMVYLYKCMSLFQHMEAKMCTLCKAPAYKKDCEKLLPKRKNILLTVPPTFPCEEMFSMPTLKAYLKSYSYFITCDSLTSK